MNTRNTTPWNRCAAGAALGLLALALGGCATAERPLYYWGDYQPQLYTYFKGTEASPLEQLAKLEITAEEARSKGLPVPPGFNAHLGLLYLKTGQLAKAQAAFVAEETAYPESKPYMDFLLKRKAAAAGPARAGVATTPQRGAAPARPVPASAAKPAAPAPVLAPVTTTTTTTSAPATKAKAPAPALAPVPAPTPAPTKAVKPV